MDPRDEREIEQALASLASDKQPETMPADVASRFDAHLKSLMAEDATVVRSSRFGKTFAERVTKNSSWLAAASILTVMAFVGVNGLSNDGTTVIPPITSEETAAPTTSQQIQLIRRHPDQNRRLHQLQSQRFQHLLHHKMAQWFMAMAKMSVEISPKLSARQIQEKITVDSSGRSLKRSSPLRFQEV